jgi:enamine deaminase RidA (YjgF/YER057c/UK114 family)
MTMRRVFSGAPWESQVGYCRAIEAAGRISVSGTAPVEPDGTTHAPGDAYRQALRCFAIAERALAELGATRADVVRTRMYVTDIARWAEYGRAHAEHFGQHPPATTMVEVRRLIDEAMLIEVELEAVRGAV